MTDLVSRGLRALCAVTVSVLLLNSTARAVDTMADWVGRNNSHDPGQTYTFDSQVLNETNVAGNFPTSDNYKIISPTSIGGAKQAKINFNFDPDRNEFETPGGTSNVNFPHSYLADQSLDGGARSFANSLHMEGTWQFDMPSQGAQGESGAEPNFCFCWYSSLDTRHRIGLGLSNTTETGFTAQPDKVRFDLFYASATGNGFVFASKDGTQTNGENALVPDGTYHFTFDYVPGPDPNSTNDTGSKMEAHITDGTTDWHAVLSPAPFAPWFNDGFALDNFGVIIRTTSGAVRNGVFNFNISDLSYTGGTAVAGVPGDYNNNGVVDAADYVAWRKGGALSNEVDNPGTVDAADYTAWRARFGNTSGSGLGAGAVPEPTSALLTLLAGLAMVGSWRRRCWS